VLSLDPRARPTPEKLLAWPAQLQAANIEVRHLSPLEGRKANLAPLREINCNALGNQSRSPILVSQLATAQGENRQMNPMLRSKTFEQSPSLRPEIKAEEKENEFKEAHFFATNWLNYVRFLHRVLKFV
jgi:hypothetical protein